MFQGECNINSISKTKSEFLLSNNLVYNTWTVFKSLIIFKKIGYKGENWTYFIVEIQAEQLDGTTNYAYVRYVHADCMYQRDKILTNELSSWWAPKGGTTS